MYQNNSIKNIIEAVNNDEYCLPVFQREFVWTQSDIIKLFDSIMQDFPIGSFVFWEVDGKTFNNCKYSFYTCIRELSQSKKIGDELERMPKKKDKITCILDGQQRISSLYIGLKGGLIKEKKTGRIKSNLHLNLLHKPETTEDEDDSPKYKFDFMTEPQREKQNDNDGEFWYPLYNLFGRSDEDEDWKLINEDLYKKSKYSKQLQPKELEKAKDMAQELRRKLYDKNLISYHLDVKRKQNRPMNIFVRTNTGGKKLTPADIFLSILSVTWAEGRDIIHKARKELNKNFGFKIRKQDILKTCLALSNHERSKIGFSTPANRKKSTMIEIRDNWPRIQESLEKATKFLWDYGYSEKTLTSNYPIIVIAYYLSYTSRYRSFDNFRLYENRTDRENIIKWFRRTLIQSVFSGSLDTTLEQIREVIKNHGKEEFPYTKITEKYPEKYPIVTEKSIDELMNKTKYGNTRCLSLLSLLSPEHTLYHPLFNTKFEQDHIFPQHLFNKKLSRFKYRRDSIENIHLIPKDKNRTKTGIDFYKWIRKEKDKYGEEQANRLMKENCVPLNVDLHRNNRFEEFLEKRGEKMRQKLKNILST